MGAVLLVLFGITETSALGGVGCVEFAAAEEEEAEAEYALAEEALVAADTLSVPFPNRSEARSASARS